MFASLNPGHIGVKTGLWDGLTLAEKYGFGGYDAQLAQLHEAVTESGAAAVKQRFVDHGLRIGAWNLPFMPYRVTREECDEWLDKLPPMLESAAAVGARRAGMWIMPGNDEREYEDNFAFHVERFRPVAKLLGQYGIRLGLEFVGPETSMRRFKHPFIRSVDETIRMAGEIGDNVGLLLDAWHWHCVGGNRDDLAKLTKQLLVHVHVDDAPAGVELPNLIDNQRKLPCTTGVIDIAGFMQALAAADYDGPVTSEPFDAELSALPPEESLPRTAKTTRSAVALAG